MAAGAVGRGSSRGVITGRLKEKVEPRVMVPWRDIEQTYERNYEKYNKPPVYVFRTGRIKCPS